MCLRARNCGPYRRIIQAPAVTAGPSRRRVWNRENSFVALYCTTCSKRTSGPLHCLVNGYTDIVDSTRTADSLFTVGLEQVFVVKACWVGWKERNMANRVEGRPEILVQDGNVDQSAYVVAYSMVDSSRVSTFVISILLIVYGSFRSLNIEQEHREKEKQKEKSSSSSSSSSFNPNTPLANGNAPTENEGGMQTIDACQALLMPVGASVSLLIMFLFFDSLQMVFAVCTAILATIAFAFLLLPMCQHIVRPCTSNNKISFGCCGRFTPAEVLSFLLSFLIVCVWILTGHWLLMDALGMGLCVAFIALVRLPSLKVSTLLLVGLLVYDVFWVFFSSYIFSTNVMVKVATRPAENPIGILAKRFHLFSLSNEAPKLSLPGKLVFPSMQNSGHFSMLGLGDIVMPGLLLCFVLRYDAYKRAQFMNGEGGLPPPPPSMYYQRITYFHCSLIGYFVGLLTATLSSEVFQATQPALLYLVPFTLLPLLIMAYLKGDLRRMWNEPFRAMTQSKYLEV